MAETKSDARSAIEPDIKYIHNAFFESPEAADVILGHSMEAIGAAITDGDRSAAGSTYFASLYERPLLTAEEERTLFRRMNYAKYRANQLLTHADPKSSEPAQTAEFQRFRAQAQECRDRLVQCNLRLVVSISRRFAEDRTHLEDLICEGNLALLNAVDKFDYDRGFRFSTYATHAVQRTFFRSLKRRNRDRQRFPTGAHEHVQEANEAPVGPDPMEARFATFNVLARVMQQRLQPRERFILEARYGLNCPTGPQTLLEVAKRMDLSKERVRQLQLRAIAKLSEEARALGLNADA